MYFPFFLRVLLEEAFGIPRPFKACCGEKPYRRVNSPKEALLAIDLPSLIESEQPDLIPEDQPRPYGRLSMKFPRVSMTL